MSKFNDYKKGNRIRTLIQIFFLSLIALIVINRELTQVGKNIPFISDAMLHSVCPFGAVASLYQVIVKGTYTHQIHDSSFVVLFLVIFLTILFGAVFCGWVCPLGTVQEWTGKLGKRIMGRNYNHIMPKKIDELLRYLRFFVLAWVLYATATTGLLAFKSLDPYYALFHFWTGEAALTAVIILVITLLGSLLIERPWCKYLCPFGAVLGILSKISFFTLKRNKETCINCYACTRACPMNIDITNSYSVRHSNCIVCLNCTSENACPYPQTMSLSLDIPIKIKTDNHAKKEIDL